jgi:hypothetical protein
MEVDIRVVLADGTVIRERRTGAAIERVECSTLG